MTIGGSIFLSGAALVMVGIGIMALGWTVRTPALVEKAVKDGENMMLVGFVIAAIGFVIGVVGFLLGLVLSVFGI